MLPWVWDAFVRESVVLHLATLQADHPMNMLPSEPIWVRSWAGARDAFRSRELRQGLYDEAGTLMQGVIVNLHGDEHRARRRLENRLFRRDTFRWYETDVIPAVVHEISAPALAAGSGDLLPMARRTMMKLACVIAGLDVRDEDFDDMFALMHRLARASTAIHATGDRALLTADGLAALTEVDQRFIQPSLARRVMLLRESSEVNELPRDVLTTLLRNQDALDLPPDVAVREVAYFPWVGSHSTSNAFVHAMHHLFSWFDAHPDDRSRVLADPLLLQSFVHESLRLHPASPETHRVAEADVEIAGVVAGRGRRVIIDMEAVNRDESVWGSDADAFRPSRALPPDASPWGMTFGHGMHACLGMELAGGVAPDGDIPAADHLLGAITTMAHHLLAAGARPDPDRPCRLDTTTTRVVYATYPVTFRSDEAIPVVAETHTAFAAQPPSA